MFESGYHRFAFFFAVAAAAVWFYAFDQWWGLIAAILLCIPAGIASFLLPSMLVGTLRQIPGLRDSFLTWLSIFGGIAVAVYGLIAFDGPARALIVLAGAALVMSGAALLKLRMNAMEHRYDRGELDDDDAQFVEEVRDFRSL